MDPGRNFFNVCVLVLDLQKRRFPYSSLFFIFAQVRNILAKILFFVSTVLLYYHQSVAHHHQDFEIASEHHNDFNTGHDEDHLPPHHIAHVFSSDQVKITVTKVFSPDLFYAHQYDISLLNHELVLTKKEYVEIRPPLLKGQSHYFSLRGPPVV